MAKQIRSTLSKLKSNNLIVLVLLLSALLLGNIKSQSTSTTLAPGRIGSTTATTTTSVALGQNTPSTVNPIKLSTSESLQNRNSSTPSSSGQNILSNSSDNITSTDIPIIVQNITQMKVIDTEILKVYFLPTEETLEMEIQLNIVEWNKQNVNKNQSQNQLQFHLGFEKPAQAIDVVSVILGNVSAGIEKIQDSHWDTKNGQLLLDKKQNYKLEEFMRTNSELITMKISRPWLTCDENDLQFSLTNMKLYWNIWHVEETLVIKEQDKNKTGEERLASTLTPGQVTPTSSPTEGTTSTAVTTMIPKPLPVNITSGHSSTITPLSATSAATQPPTPVKTLENLFQGPFNVSLNALFRNFSYLHLQGCGNIFSSKTFECSFLEYQNKSFLTIPSSPLFIVKAIHQPKSARKSTTPASVVACPKENLNGRGWGRTNKSLEKSTDNFVERALPSSNIYLSLIVSILMFLQP